MEFIYETEDTTKTLDDTSAVELVGVIPKKYKVWNDKRQRQIDDTKIIRDSVYFNSDAKKDDEWGSSFDIPDLFEIKQTLKAHLWENTYSSIDNMFNVDGMDAEAEKNELAQKATLTDAFKNMKVQKELDKSFDDLVDTGDISLFVGWETKVKQVRRKKNIQDYLTSDIADIKNRFVIEDKIIYDGAKVKRIDPLSLVFDEDKNNFIYRTFEKPQKLKENKVYNIKDFEALENIAKGQIDDSIQQDKNQKIYDTSVISRDGKIEVIEYWGDIKLENGDLLKNWLIVVAGRNQVIRFERNPFVECPFVYSNVIENPLTGRGLSILKPVHSISELSSKVLNKQIDALALIINPPYLAPRGAFKGEQVVKPGKIIEYDASLMPTAPVPLSFDKAMTGWDFLTYFKSLIETTTGVFKNMSGADENDTTATEIKARVGGQNSRLSMITDVINQDVIVPMVEKTADLLANFKFDVQTIKSVNKGTTKFINIDNSVRQGNYKYNYSDRSAIQEKKLRTNELVGMLKEFMQLSEVRDKVDPMKLLAYVTEQSGFDDIEEKIKRDETPPPPPPQPNAIKDELARYAISKLQLPDDIKMLIINEIEAINGTNQPPINNPQILDNNGQLPSIPTGAQI